MNKSLYSSDLGVTAAGGAQPLCALVQPDSPAIMLADKGESHAPSDPTGERFTSDDGTGDEIPAITHVDRIMIRAYFRHDSTPGFAQTEVKPGRPAPAHAVKKLPRDLEAKLSALPAGYERVLVGNDVVLIESETQTIVDLVRDADDPSLA